MWTRFAETAARMEVAAATFKATAWENKESMNWKRIVERKARGSIFFIPFRNAYQFAFNRPRWRSRRQMHQFYSQFVHPGELVFDIGANAGEYTEMFAKLSARVVAVEANPQLIDNLKKIRPRNLIQVEATAVGATEGSADLYLCGQDLLGTLSRDWISVAEKSQRLSEFKWQKFTVVPVTTLDALIAKHGEPKFIKIDVEGFESEVLAGLTSAPSVLSFEFNTEYLEQAETCLRQKCIPRGGLFNVILQMQISFVFERWITAEELSSYLRSEQIRALQTWGDIFVCSR